jgi:DNA-binding NtrC family response regulator
VLVVDDEESVRAATAPMLRRLGFDVALAADGRAALDAFRADPNRYSLVLLDLTMPHLDGEQTFTELRRLRPDVRVVLMSGFSEQDAVARFTGKGLAAFLQKPFTFEALSAELQRIVSPVAEPAGKPTAKP